MHRPCTVLYQTLISSRRYTVELEISLWIRMCAVSSIATVRRTLICNFCWDSVVVLIKITVVSLAGSTMALLVALTMRVHELE